MSLLFYFCQNYQQFNFVWDRDEGVYFLCKLYGFKPFLKLYCLVLESV